jgi:xanthine dehydrogenase accessory factor
MAFTDDGDMVGSVSGGCVESAVAQAAQVCLNSGRSELLSFTASYQAAWDVGLSCGGEMEILVQPLDVQRYFCEKLALGEDKSYTRLVVTKAADTDLLGTTLLCDGQGVFFSSLPGNLTMLVWGRIKELPQTQICGKLEIGKMLNLSFSRQRTRPQLICVGGTHIAVFLTQIAHPLGYSTVVIDPRGIFATQERFPHVDVLTHAWPQQAFTDLKVTQETAICILTHDPKIDLPALELALATPAFYIGSLGRSSTQRQRYNSLIKRGLASADIKRIYGPIGLDLGGRSPEEIALSIFSEITAVRYGSDGASHRMWEFAERGERKAGAQHVNH